MDGAQIWWQALLPLVDFFTESMCGGDAFFLRYGFDRVDLTRYLADDLGDPSKLSVMISRPRSEALLDVKYQSLCCSACLLAAHSDGSLGCHVIVVDLVR